MTQQPMNSQLMQLNYPQHVAEFTTYEEAQAAVDYLADNRFPVENLLIVGTNLKLLERVTGRRVFGTFPVREDPKSAVIWEAFQPESEPRRTLRRAGEEQELAAAADRTAPARRRAPSPPRPQETAPRPAQPAQPAEDFLARQGGIY